MTALDQLRRQLEGDEGIRFSPYRDSVGKLTIGIGHNLDDKPLSRTAVETIFEDDVADVVAILDRRLPWAASLDDARKGVLMNMCFQMGEGGLMGFPKMLAALKAGDYARAADEMRDSTWHAQTPQRCERLARQMTTGEWQFA